MLKCIFRHEKDLVTGSRLPPIAKYICGYLLRQRECGATVVKILTLKLELAAKFDLVKDKMSTQF
jgi:hypothetical protein